jgi:hypothetical protein
VIFADPACHGSVDAILMYTSSGTDDAGTPTGTARAHSQQLTELGFRSKIVIFQWDRRRLSFA